MTLASLAWLWFALALGCILAGLALTGRRMDAMPPAQRAIRQRTRKPGRSLCSHCAQPLDSGARFCGGCGQRVGRKLRQRVIPLEERKGERV